MENENFKTNKSSDFEQAINSHKNKEGSKIGRLRKSFANKDYSAIINEIEELEPAEYAEVFYFYGYSLMKKCKIDKSISAFRQSLTFQKKWKSYYYLADLIEKKVKKLPEKEGGRKRKFNKIAKQFYKLALRLNPPEIREIDIKNRLGHLAFMLDEYQIAIDYLTFFMRFNKARDKGFKYTLEEDLDSLYLSLILIGRNKIANGYAGYYPYRFTGDKYNAMVAIACMMEDGKSFSEIKQELQTKYEFGYFDGAGKILNIIISKHRDNIINRIV